MAYISTEKVKNVRNLVKENFPTKDGWKFRVYQTHHLSLHIRILQAPIDLMAGESDEFHERGYKNVSPYYLWKMQGDKGNILKKIDEIARSQSWYNNSDAMTDYFDTAYYYDIEIGDWQHPFKFVDKKGYKFSPFTLVTKTEKEEEAPEPVDPTTEKKQSDDFTVRGFKMVNKSFFCKSNFRLENEFLILELKADDFLFRNKKSNHVFSAKSLRSELNIKGNINQDRLNALWFEYYYIFSENTTLSDLISVELNKELV